MSFIEPLQIAVASDGLRRAKYSGNVRVWQIQRNSGG
jgi:hypothetical protein